MDVVACPPLLLCHMTQPFVMHSQPRECVALSLYLILPPVPVHLIPRPPPPPILNQAHSSYPHIASNTSFTPTTLPPEPRRSEMCLPYPRVIARFGRVAVTGNCFGSSGVGDLLRTLHVEHIQNSPSLLVAIGGAYSLGQNLALHEQARIWISWCCRMFGMKVPLESFS